MSIANNEGTSSPRRFLRHCAYLAVLAGLAGTAGAGESGLSGHEIYQQRCRVCHGGTAPADVPLGPSLAGIVGSQAGMQPSGVHSRATVDSGIAWNRQLLRDFLSVPRRVIPGAIMSCGVEDPNELERLLDFLETLR